MTTMAAMPIKKNKTKKKQNKKTKKQKEPLKTFTKSEQSLILKLGLQHCVLKFYQIPSNDDPRSTFDLFRHWVSYAFLWERAETNGGLLRNC